MLELIKFNSNILSTAIICGIIVPYYLKEKSIFKRIMKFLVVAVPIFIFGTITHSVVYNMKSSSAQEMVVIEIMSEIRLNGFIKAVFNKVSGSEDSIRELVVKHVQSKSDGNELRNAIIQLRKQYLVPAMRTAKPDLIEREYKARRALHNHLSKTNITLCSEFFFSGLNNIGGLDDEGLRYFNSLTEVIGEIISAEPGFEPLAVNIAPQEFANIFQLGELSLDEMKLFIDMSKANHKEICDLATKFYAIIDKKDSIDKIIINRFMTTTE